MTRDTEAMLLLVMATLVGRLAVQGGYQNYVKTGLFWPLVLSAATLAIVGALTYFGSRRVAEGALHGVAADGGHQHHGHDDDGHGHGDSRVGMLLLAPVIVLALIAPAPLGAFAAERGSANQITDPGTYRLPDLPEPVNGAVDVTIGQMLTRAFWGEPEDTVGVTVRIVGFAMPTDEGAIGQEFLLTRFAVGCCAADGLVRQVLVDGANRPIAKEQWVEIVGSWTGEMVEETYPVIEVRSVTPIDEPDQPYEY